MARLLAPNLTRVAYRDHLARLYGILPGLEARLWAEPDWHGWLGDTDERRKTPWLVADLTSLGVPDAAVLPSAPSAEPLTAAQAFGVAYVLEGATLGGAVIGRQLRRSVGVTPECGGRYYHSYGAERGRRWKRMQQALDAFGAAHPHALDEVARAASATFEAMHAWMVPPVSVDAQASPSNAAPAL